MRIEQNLWPEKPYFTDAGQIADDLLAQYRKIIAPKDDDYRVVLHNCRLFTEHICKYYFTSGKTEMQPSLADMIISLKKNKLVPDEIINSLYPVKNYGNLGSHSNSSKLTGEMVIACKYHLHIVLEWFFRENNLPGEIPPSSYLMISRKRKLFSNKEAFLNNDEVSRNKQIFAQALHAHSAQDPAAALILLEKIDSTSLKDADLIAFIKIVSSFSRFRTDLGLVHNNRMDLITFVFSVLKGTLIFYFFKYGPEYFFYALLYPSTREKKIKKIVTILQERYT